MASRFFGEIRFVKSVFQLRNLNLKLQGRRGPKQTLGTYLMILKRVVWRVLKVGKDTEIVVKEAFAAERRKKS